MAARKQSGRRAAKRGRPSSKTVARKTAATTSGRARASAQQSEAQERGARARAHNAARRAEHEIDSALEAVMPVATGMEQMMRSWMGFFQRAAMSQTRLMEEMFSLRPTSDALRAQLDFVGANLRNLAESSGEVLQASSRLAERAQQAEKVGRRSAERLGQAYRDHAEAQLEGLQRGGNGFAGRGEAGRRMHLS